MSRIAQCFERCRDEGRTALIPFVTAGDPDPEQTVPVLHALVAGGADLIELGVPFSDPIADGPVIQRSSERALTHAVSLAQVLDWVREFRQRDEHTPVVLMGYLNPFELYGFQAFASDANAAGVDGVLAVDLPPEATDEFAGQLEEAGLDHIYLLAPTSSEARLASVAGASSGYVYYVSLKGVTGAELQDGDALGEKLAAIRAHTSLPLGVGFGIKDPDAARRVAAHADADAVVVGSALVESLFEAHSAGADLSARATDLARDFAAALRG